MLGHGGFDGFGWFFPRGTDLTAFAPLLNVLVAFNPVVSLPNSLQGFRNTQMPRCGSVVQLAQHFFSQLLWLPHRGVSSWCLPETIHKSITEV